MPSYQKALIVFTLFIGSLFRLYKLDSSIADWHSHRQADTISVTKNFLKNGIDLLRPTYHDLSDTQSGKDNPNGYRMVEFPVYNFLSLFAHNLLKIFFPHISLEISSRLVSIFLSILSSLLIFLICFQITHQFWPSFLSFTAFLILPFSIYYSRTTLPEPTAVFFSLLAFYLFKKTFFLSAISLSLAALTKPYVVIILFPAFLFSSLDQNKFKINPKYFLRNTLYIILSLLPLLLWRRWILQFPEGIPASNWLLNSSTSTALPEWFHGYNLTFLNKMVAFKPYWFKWLFEERLSILILGSFGLIPAFLGFAYLKNYSQFYLFSFLAGILLFFITIAGGNIQHDYYQFLVIPFLSIFLGFGYYYLQRYTFKNRLISVFTILIIFSLSFFFSGSKIKEYYKINNPLIVQAGERANSLLPQNALIVAPYNGDTAFLYQTNRSGWPVEIYNFDNLKKQHPQNPIYLVSVNYDKYTNDITQKYNYVFKNDQFIILNLQDEIK